MAGGAIRADYIKELIIEKDKVAPNKTTVATEWTIRKNKWTDKALRPACGKQKIRGELYQKRNQKHIHHFRKGNLFTLA